MRGLTWVGLMVGVTASACVHVKPMDFGPQGEARTAEEVLKRVELVEQSVYALTGDAKLKIDTPQGSGAVGLFLAVLHPASIHLEQLDFFGRPQGVMVTDGAQFGLYDAQAGKYLHGPATAPNLGRFLPLVVPPPELAALLLGRVPRIPHDTASLRVDPKAGVYVVTLQKGAVSQELHVLPPSYRVVKSHVEGIRAYDVEFGDVEQLGGVWYPKHAVLSSEVAKTRLELNAKDIELNPSPDLTMFELAAPENVPSLEVDAAGEPRGPQ